MNNNIKNCNICNQIIREEESGVNPKILPYTNPLNYHDQRNVIYITKDDLYLFFCNSCFNK